MRRKRRCGPLPDPEWRLILEARRKGFVLFCGPGFFILTDSRGRVLCIGPYAQVKRRLEGEDGEA